MSRWAWKKTTHKTNQFKTENTRPHSNTHGFSDGRLLPVRCHLCSVSPGWPLPERPVQCPGYICWCYQLMSRTHAGPGPCPWEWQRTGEEQKKRNVMKQNEKRWRKTYGADVHTGKKGTDVSVTKTDDCIDKSGTSWRPLPYLSHFCSSQICRTVARRVSSPKSDIMPGS